MVDLEDIESKTKQLIQAYVEEHWAKSQSVCYFSSIGVYLNWCAPETRAVLSRGLGDFLRQNPVVRVVRFPGVAQKVGAIPITVPLPENISDLFSRSKASSSSEHRHVYLQEFWNAFIRPTEGSPRYVLLDEASRISVHDGPVDIEGKAYEIQSDDLTPSSSSASIADKVNATHAAIDVWLTKNSLRRIDKLFLEYPFYGSRQMVRHLWREGDRVGRHRVRRLMRLMGLQATWWR